MFQIDMMPAAHGDCLWIEYGDRAKPHRVLIDGGAWHTYPHLFDRVQRLAPDDRHFEAFVITHIDADHIEGSIRLLHDAEALGVTFGRIWFNGSDQLAAVPKERGEILGAEQGEYLGFLIKDYEAAAGVPVINVGFGDFVGVVDDGQSLPVVELDGGLKLTLLSPDLERLRDLDKHWQEVIAETELAQGASGEKIFRMRLATSKRLRGLAKVEDREAEDDADLEMLGEVMAGPARGPLLGSDRSLGSDSSSANGSSIALLAEHDDGSALLSGDAFAHVLTASLRRVAAERGVDRVKVDAFKLPHHGSASNLSVELLEVLSAKHYLISTNGAMFKHPHDLTLDTILEHRHSSRGKPEFHFNYHSPSTAPWASKAAQKQGGFKSHYPMGTSFSMG